jgi:hypothetical protein
MVVAACEAARCAGTQRSAATQALLPDPGAFGRASRESAQSDAPSIGSDSFLAAVLRSEPLWPTALHAVGLEAVAPKQSDGFIGEEAVGAAAIGDHRAIAGESRKLCFELFGRDGDRSGKMPAFVFKQRPDIDKGDVASGHAPLHGFRGERWARIRHTVVADNAVHLGQPCLSDSPEREPELEDIDACEPVDGLRPVLL